MACDLFNIYSVLQQFFENILSPVFENPHFVKATIKASEEKNQQHYFTFLMYIVKVYDLMNQNAEKKLQGKIYIW